MARALRVLLLLGVAGIAAGMIAGWRVSIQFVRSDTDGRGRGLPAIRLPESDTSVDGSRNPGVAVPGAPGAGRSSRPLSPSLPGTASGRALPTPPVDASRSPQRSSGLHVTFQRTWHPVTYEVGSPAGKPPVRVLCGDCPAPGSVPTAPSDQSGNAVTSGASGMPGGAKVTLVEWAP